MPVGDGEAVGLADEAFVEQGVVGAFGGCGVLAGGDWVDGARACDGVADGEGELVPADLPFVAVIVDAGDEGGGEAGSEGGGKAGSGGGGSDDLQDGGGKVGGIGG